MVAEDERQGGEEVGKMTGSMAETGIILVNIAAILGLDWFPVQGIHNFVFKYNFWFKYKMKQITPIGTFFTLIQAGAASLIGCNLTL